jgi:Asp-tRNA(Asn)/Glu-tRNA(Gln) amidotransferase A subunit family amidase
MLPALDLARRIEAGKLSPVAVIERCAEAIMAREAEVGAFVTLDLERARRMVEARGEALAAQPLRGLPVGLKDIFDTADFPTEYGSPIYAGHQPKADSAVASLVRRAGGIVLGKTVTTEFAHLDPGKTRNPHNLAHTPGGSSSGSAAGVAAGMLPIATGSQTGGSIIRPASYCGVAGFKPSYGLIPTVGMKCFSWLLDTVGLFAAGVVDVAFAAEALTGRALRVDRADPVAPRIGLLRRPPWPQASDEMTTAVEIAARTAEAAGATVTEIELPPICADAFTAHGTIHDYEGFHALAYEYDHHRDRIGPNLRNLLDRAAGVTPEAYDSARRTTRRARQALAGLMAEIDVILTPSAPGAAPKGLSSTGTSTFNRLWTLMGTPCVNVPGLANDAGLPLGVQVVGRFGSDRATLMAARFVEAAVARFN